MGGSLHSMLSFDSSCMNDTTSKTQKQTGESIHDQLHSSAALAANWCRDINNWDAFWKHVVLIFASRFFKPTTRFVGDGTGMPVHVPDPTKRYTGKFFPNGQHIMHGIALPSYKTMSSDGKDFADSRVDIVILRPNIEHEMLGLIMGRGGTQELGATFWGQTELSCYDDAQHGIWGMSYKYHERAMVTNERNLIRTYDVAFDGYNGGLDQSAVRWDDPTSCTEFRNATYDRNKPYHGPSMLVMALPAAEKVRAWPNPIVFHAQAHGNASPDPEKSNGALPDINRHMVFNHSLNPELCPLAVQEKYQEYMRTLQVTQWANVDQSNRPAGEACISNETSSSPLAFQGSMRVTQQGHCVEDIKGSGHLGHSYVGIASVREGRGILNAATAPAMHRMI